MKVVKSFDVKEFRGIRRLERPMELGKFNVLVGRNCGGKTSILQALYLLAMPMLTMPISPYGRSAIEYVGDLVKGLSRLVYGYSGEAVIDLELGVRGALKNLSYSQKTFDVVHVEGVRVSFATGSGAPVAKVRASLDGEEAEISIDGQTYLELVSSLNPEGSALALYVPNESEAYRKLHDYSLRNIDGIVKRGLHTRVFREQLKGVVYDRFTEVFPRDGELFARKEVGGTAIYVSLNDLGEGVRRFVLTYFAVEHVNPALVLWDDVEVAAHPSLMDALLRWLAESERQVVISTHSLDVLQSVALIEPEDARIILLKKDGDDVLHHRSLELDELKDILEGGIDLRAMVEGVVP
jgi:energy-coupling factor transporter ATP-binding protein EcfA2